MRDATLSDNQSPSSLTMLRRPDFIFSVGLVLLVVGGLSGELRWWTDDGVVLAAAFRYVALLALPLLAYSAYGARKSGKPIALDPGGFAVGLIFIFFSGWLDNGFALLPGATIRGELLIITLIAALFSPRARTGLVYCAAILTPILLIWSLSQVAAGRLIFSDDHSVMIYRLNLLKQNFPNIPHYNPLWNTGLDSRDYFATGILNIFFFFYPLIQFFAVEQVYNIIVALTAFVLLPLSVYSATRLIGQTTLSAAIASILAVSSNLLWYRWVLKYGAIGFVFSACILPLVVALFYRFTFNPNPVKKRETAVLIGASCLMLLWSPTALFLAPLALVLVTQSKRVFAQRRAWITATLIAALTLPWVAVFISVSGVSSFITAPTSLSQAELKESHQTSIARALKGGKALLAPSSIVSAIRENGSKANPLLIVFALPGLVLLSKRSSRAVFFILAVWLTLLGTVGNALKPQLELDRALIVLGLLLSIPSAVAIEALLKRSASKTYQMIMPSIVCGFLFCGIFASTNIVFNRSVENYTFAEEIVTQLPQAVVNFGGDGRSVFPGFILHEFNNAHVAPTALMTGHPMVASSPFHNLWWYTELVPQEFLERGESGVEEYFELINASSVIVHDPRWRTYFSARPQIYTLKWRYLNFSLFTRKRLQPSYIREGIGEIKAQDSRSVTLVANSPRIVLKFNYFDFLRSSSCSLHPFAVAGTRITLIELRDCPVGQLVTISAAPAWRRVFK